jgi:PAS domain S-box-containing protein/putative nucleotidyltransferase with HDIG domain
MAEVNERLIKFGKKKAILRVARDISKRKDAEKALLREKNFSNAVINSSPGLLFVFGEKGNIIQWNSNAENITGYSASEIAKMNIFDFVAKEDIKSAAAAAQEAFTSGQASIEINILSKPGKKIPFYITGRSAKIENATCVVCSGVDITERRQAEEEVKRGYEQLRETFHSTVKALAATVEMRDRYTAGHQPRVSQLACAIAGEMGLSPEQIEGIRMAASLHDIGKILVPAEILNKPGPITELQFEMIKMHPQAGYDILKGIQFPWPVAEIVWQHHERLDGSGYPRGLKDDEIMPEARILIVANALESMTEHRPYRPAADIQGALLEISKDKGILYDPGVVDTCVKLFTEKAFNFSNG